jgi:site-specific recombinase XerD
VRYESGRRRAISREQAWRILTEAFAANELSGKLGTHAMRKTFANRMYDLLKHDLVKV